MRPDEQLMLATVALMFVPVFLCGFAARDLWQELRTVFKARRSKLSRR